MKKIYTTLSLLFFLASATYAGNCGVLSTNTPKAATGIPGLTPLSDSFPTIIKGTFIDQTIYFENFDTVYLGGSQYIIQSVKVDSVENLPAGLCWKTNKANNTFAGKETGVIEITGTTTAPAGQYKLRIMVTAVTNLFTVPTVDAEQLAGLRYFVRVGCPGFPEVAVDSASPYPAFKSYAAQTCTGLPTVAITSLPASGVESINTARFVGTLSAVSGTGVSVGASFAGSATSTSDYTVNKSSFSFAAGQLKDTIVVTIVDDAVAESNESITTIMTNPVGALLGSPTSATYTIIDNDGVVPTLSISAASASLSEAAGTVQLIASLSAAAGVITSGVTFTGTAANPADYTLSKTNFSFAAGQLKDTITVTIVNDAVTESNETIIATLNSPVGATLGSPASSTFTILDNDGIGIENLDLMKAITVYPNPSYGSFTVDIPATAANHTLSIIDASGRTIKQAYAIPGNNTINTEGLASGVYTLLFVNTYNQTLTGTKQIQITK